MQTHIGWCTGVCLLFFITGILNVLTAVSKSVLGSNEPTKKQIPQVIAIFMAAITLEEEG